MNNVLQIKKQIIDIIGYDSGWGCCDFGCEDGPAALSADTILQSLAASGVGAQWTGALGLKFLSDHASMDDKAKTLPHVLTALHRLHARVHDSVKQGRVPAVIGGDHSSAIGTFSGVTNALKAQGRFGLIWIDAHLDSHTPETSWQGKFGGWWHGQPVAALTGHGVPEFVALGGLMAKINPAHMSIIGAHSFEPAEKEYVERQRIRVYYLDEVHQRGFNTVFAEAMIRANQDTAGFGLSIDLDAFRPEDAPGVGAAEDTGMAAADVLPVLSGVGRHAAFRALEIVELNPHRDAAGKTAALAESLFKYIFKN
jgi:arginase